jgi:dihydrodiol dehydrogenase / D-xylose 1-dehydrogenase (NADP)
MLKVWPNTAVWTRFFPLINSLLDHLHTRKSIGTVDRMFIDFGIPLPLDDLPANARHKDPALGAGALLDIGIYNLTYASLILGGGVVGRNHPTPKVISTMVIVDGIDYADVVVLKYPQKDAKQSGRESMAICTTTMYHETSRDFCTIEGSEGTITIYGLAASVPSGFRIKRKRAEKDTPAKVANYDAEEDVKFEHAGVGYHFEADAVAIDIAADRTENTTMPLHETLRMMSLMDGIRKACGLVYPQERCNH